MASVGGERAFSIEDAKCTCHFTIKCHWYYNKQSNTVSRTILLMCEHKGCCLLHKSIAQPLSGCSLFPFIQTISKSKTNFTKWSLTVHTLSQCHQKVLYTTSFYLLFKLIFVLSLSVSWQLIWQAEGEVLEIWQLITMSMTVYDPSVTVCLWHWHRHSVTVMHLTWLVQSLKRGNFPHSFIFMCT